jgi:flavin reductase (DIM6/NTAB) family NADH-FMN oxidoreductase RutF
VAAPDFGAWWENQALSAGKLDSVLGRVPSGIFILTCGTGQRSTGMLTSWVMQAGFSPPMVTVALNRERHIGEYLARSQPFVLNIVGESHRALIKHFGKGFTPGDPSVFQGLEITHCPRGVPILTHAIGHLECEPVGHLDSMDHRVFLAKVVRGRLTLDEPPLVHIRKSGAHY